MREEQRRDPRWREHLERSLDAAQEAIARKKAAGGFAGTRLPAGAPEKGLAALARIRRLDQNFDKRIGGKVSRARGSVKTEKRRCEACGGPFEHVAWMTRKTYSEDCSRELRRRLIAQHGPSEGPQARPQDLRASPGAVGPEGARREGQVPLRLRRPPTSDKA